MMTDDLLLNDNNGIDIKQLEQQLEYDAESAIFIAALPSMFPENHELTFGKSPSSLGLIPSLVKESCVSDEEDVKRSQFIIHRIDRRYKWVFWCQFTCW